MQAIAANARLLSNDQLAAGLIEDAPFRIQLASVFPFYAVAGDALRYATTPALRPGVTIDFGAPIAEDTKHPAEQQRQYRFAEIATQFRVTYRAQDVFSSNVNDQTAVQCRLAIRELLYRFWTLFESGDARNEGEFDGLMNLVEPARTLDLGGEPLTLEVLDRAKELVRANDGRGVVVFTSSVGKRAIQAAHWSRGIEPDRREMSFAGPCGRIVGERVLHFDGSPVYVNDLNRVMDGPDRVVRPGDLHDGDAGSTDIWFLAMGENRLHGITPAALGDRMFVTRRTILADGSTCVHHITMPTGIALGSAAALAVVSNATIPA